MNNTEHIFVVETCQNCKEHHWNTRHDEIKYNDFFNKISSAILSRLPNAVVLRNQIPKSYLPYDLYCNLIPNEDDNKPVYDQVPRTGSFEVSYKGMLIFSKLQSSFWPNTQLVADKCYNLVQDESQNKDLTQYLAGNSPNKGGLKSRAGKSPMRGGYNNENFGNQASFKASSPSRENQQKFSQNQQTSSPSKPQQSVQQQQQTFQQQMQEQAAEKERQEKLKREQQEREQQLQRQQEELARQQQEMQRQLEAQRQQQKEQEERQRQMELKNQKRQQQEDEKKRQEEIRRQEEAERILKEQQLAEQMRREQEEENMRKEHERRMEEQKQQEQVKQAPVHQDPKFLGEAQAKLDTVPNHSSRQSIAGDDNYNEDYEPVEEAPEEDIEAGAHLKSPDNLYGYPVFPPDCKSLLKKYLSREVWQCLKNAKDKHGFGFKQAIFSGCQNTDSSIGVYAGSHDSYYSFADLFDSIIEDYHGHKKDAKHISDMDYKKLNAPPLAADEASMIRSTRIRVGRNLADYPLGPGLSREQRKEIEDKVVRALSSFDGELAGKYYALSSLSEPDRKQLIEDHFLFKEGDRFLEACGLNRDWPEGRGIFHNNEKTFLVWVNEEDQLRIISMQNGADIGAVFTRLSKACEHIETVAKFSNDDHLGYITSCPTNLGTALRASVHIYLPYLGERKEEFEQIASKYHVQIRGAHGEHTETNDHIYDISNKRRLGRSEVDLVQDMYDGVKAMIQREKELMPEPKEEWKEIEVGSHLNSVDDLQGYPLFPEGTHSLLSQYLTKEVWTELKDSVDKHGFSFRQAIFSGCKNTDSGIGVYAGSHDSYHAFAPLFDNIIENYHGHQKDATHVSNMDFSKLIAPPLPEEEAALIKSTRIRVGRNLADYPLGPGLSKDQRKEIEQKVVQALTSFDGELAGKYYPLSSLSDQDRKQLIEDHFLFKEGDRFLEACGLNRDWPEGRGIFHNNEKTFLVWVNEEDQLRIISMQNGADIGAVFTRLSKACSHIETVAKFSHDDHLGYITSCPTNLGTALRASVHIKLPYLGQKKEEFQAIADQYFVQIRGAHGEHSESDDHIYDISNKRRLGRSEVDLVQDMYNGVKAMIKRELELRPKEEAKPQVIEQEEEKNLEVGRHLKSFEELSGFPVFPEGTKSLLSKSLTHEVWKKLHAAKDSHGFSFKQAIFSGCQNTDSSIGVYAGSHDSYHAFADLFDKIIDDYHGHQPDAKHISDMDYSKLNCPPFSENEAKLIKSTRIRVGRNLKDYPLGPGLSKEQRLDVEQKVVQALNSFEGELQGKYYSLGSLNEEERKQLIEDHFLFKEGDRFLEACGLNRDWPEGRGIFHNNEKTFLVWVNEEDQLRIISMQNGADIGAVFTRLSKACSHIEKVAQFAHDEHLGYITSCPTNLGTALRASVHIYLPNLGERHDEFQSIADQFHVQIRGAHGEHTETNDHIYDISNKRRLGRSEVDLVQDMYNGVKAMIHREIELSPKKEEEEVALCYAVDPKEDEDRQNDLIQCGFKLNEVSDMQGGELIFPPGTKSLLSKYCTKEVWVRNKLKKDKYGFSFKQAILSGCRNTDSSIGVYAGSYDSYYSFKEIFDPIIEAYHGHKPDSQHKSDMDSSKLDCPPLIHDSNHGMIISTRIRVGRNLADFPLGPGLTRDQRLKVEEQVAEALKSFDGDLKGTYYSLGQMSEDDKQKLIKEHFLFKEGDRFLETAGLNRDWPEGRGIYHNDQLTFLVWVNEEDQLRIISMENGSDIKNVFERLSRACSHIEKTVKFSFDDHLGYITSCPTNLGTALRASVHIRLPKLGQNREQFEQMAQEHHVQIRGIDGEHSESQDHIYDISNKRRLGLTEVELVQDMYNGVKAMIEAELSL